MSEKSLRPHLSQRLAAADCINQALEKSDIAEICHAIGAATHLHNMSDIAKNLEWKDRAFIELFPVGQRVQISKPF